MATNLSYQLMTTRQAATHLGISVGELKKLRRAPAGPDWVKIGRTIRHIQEDLNWWLEQRNAH